MFRPLAMARISALVLQKDLQAVLDALGGVGIVHLGVVADEMLGSSLRAIEREPDVQRLDQVRDRIGRLMDLLGIQQEEGRCQIPIQLDTWEQRAGEIVNRVESLLERRRGLKDQDEDLKQVTQLLAHLEPADGTSGTVPTFHWAHLFVGRMAAQGLDNLYQANPSAIVSCLERMGERALVAVLTTRGLADTVEGQLRNARFTPLAGLSDWTGSVQEARRNLDMRLQEVMEEQGRIDAEIERLAGEQRDWLLDCWWTLSVEIRLVEARQRFGYTERTALLSGWLPIRQLGLLERTLRETCGQRFLLQSVEARGDETPVQFKNPSWLRPFQKILAVYGTPTYEEIEPTPLLAIGFLLLFGMMFGDVGHGLAFVVGGLLLRRTTRFRDEGLIVAQMGGVASVFGLLFGSVFGSEQLIGPFWFSPMHDIPRLMLTALSLGVALVLVGLSVRIVNGVREGHRLALLTDRLGVAGLVFYGGAVVSAVLVWQGRMSGSALIWLAAPLAAVFLHPLVEARGHRRTDLSLLLVEGAIEVLETILGYLANTFSFLRVGAFGLAHVGLSMAVFAVADKVAGLPLGLLWVGLVHLLGNAIILLLEGLVVTVQTVRLQFYEFFSKFFRGGGVVYRPFSLPVGSKRRGTP